MENKISLMPEDPFQMNQNNPWVISSKPPDLFDKEEAEGEAVEAVVEGATILNMTTLTLPLPKPQMGSSMVKSQ